MVRNTHNLTDLSHAHTHILFTNNVIRISFLFITMAILSLCSFPPHAIFNNLMKLKTHSLIVYTCYKLYLFYFNEKKMY